MLRQYQKQDNDSHYVYHLARSQQEAGYNYATLHNPPSLHGEYYDQLELYNQGRILLHNGQFLQLLRNHPRKRKAYELRRLIQSEYFIIIRIKIGIITPPKKSIV